MTTDPKAPAWRVVYNERYDEWRIFAPHDNMSIVSVGGLENKERAHAIATMLSGGLLDEHPAREALDGIVMVCGRTGNSLEDFEEQAAAFQRETGKMRPGKDQPVAGPDIGASRQEYHEWVETKVNAARAALAAGREGEG